jgi:predicted transcriptional regulator
MPATTSLKLPDSLKTTIAKVAASEGKTAHALMVDALHTNAVFSGVDVKAYVMARVKGGKPRRPKALPHPGRVQKK